MDLSPDLAPGLSPSLYPGLSPDLSPLLPAPTLFGYMGKHYFLFLAGIKGINIQPLQIHVIQLVGNMNGYQPQYQEDHSVVRIPHTA